MNKLVCIACPAGCEMILEIKNGKVISVKNNKCHKGSTYAAEEIESPKRVITTCVKTDLSVKWLPVKTSSPVPKEKLFDFLAEISKIKISKPVKAGDKIAEKILGFEGIDLIAGRTIEI
ncbi:MAG: DUF1667 domain-containing protein [Elusimicrobiota bacterium]